MEWQAWSARLSQVLGLRKAPVAITYTDAPPAGASDRKCRACAALRLASQGAVIDVTAGNSACAGGALYLGLRPQSPEEAPVLREFLINGEKLLSSPAAIHRMNALARVKPPFGTAEHVIFSPLDRAELCPDVAVFTCNAGQGARLVNLAYYETGAPFECDPTGSLCRSVITYPLVTGQVNVSFGDVTARRAEGFQDDELFVTLPWTHLRSVMASLDRCGAGTAKHEIPASMRELMARQAGELPEL